MGTTGTRYFRWPLPLSMSQGQCKFWTGDFNISRTLNLIKIKFGMQVTNTKRTSPVTDLFDDFEFMGRWSPNYEIGHKNLTLTHFQRPWHRSTLNLVWLYHLLSTIYYVHATFGDLWPLSRSQGQCKVQMGEINISRTIDLYEMIFGMQVCNTKCTSRASVLFVSFAFKGR